MSGTIEKAKLKITLKSDLICGSGTAFSNVIDTDVIFDEYGFPYIPARRIRGLIKEAANEYAQFDSSKKDLEERLFGEENSHHFVLRNATLDNVNTMRKEINGLSRDQKRYVNTNAVLSYYTTLRNQTRINNEGIAEDNSLRTSRAIKRGNVFYAPIEFEKEDKEELEKLLVFVKHMGVNRTRGFGDVVMCLETENSEKNGSKFEQLKGLKDEQTFEIQLCVENKGQLSITGSEGETTIDYIPGSNVLGYFAGQYIKGNNGNQKEFNQLFLEGKLHFKNGYISDQDWNRYYPIKESIFKEKTSKQFFDRSKNSNEGTNHIISKVRGKYFSQKNKGMQIREVKKEMAYHHRRPDDKSIGHVVSNVDGLGMFYQTEVISAGQRFILPIEGKGKYLKKVLSNDSNYIQIGGSKFTQYGNIEVKEIKEEKLQKNSKTIPAGTEVVAILLSPALILNEQLFNDLSVESLSKACHLENVKDEYKYIDYVRVGGYNAKWRLQKPSYTAFKSGSCLRGTLTEDTQRDFVIGQLNNEGLGQVRLQRIEELPDRIEEVNDLRMDNYTKIKDKQVRAIYYLSKVQESLQEFTEWAIDKKGKELTASEIGRVLMMINDSETWETFNDQVKMIANSERKGKIQQAVKEVTKKASEIIKRNGLGDYLHSNEKDFSDFYIKAIRIYFTNRKLEKRDS